MALSLAARKKAALRQRQNTPAKRGAAGGAMGGRASNYARKAQASAKGALASKKKALNSQRRKSGVQKAGTRKRVSRARGAGR